MAGLSLSERLQILSDPRPAEFNPDEEDWELLSGAKLTQSRTYDDEGDGFSSVGRKGGVSSARWKRSRRVAGGEVETDPRYAGRPVSRRELFGDTESGNEEAGSESEIDQSDEELGSCDHQIDQSDEEVESYDNQEKRGGDLGSIGLSFSATESEEEEDGGEEEEGEEEEEGGGEEEEGEEEEEGVKEGGREEEGEGEGGGFTALAMDKVQEDIEKGKAVREQIRLWDGLMEGRIRLHKILSLANSLPQTSVMPVFMRTGGEPVSSSRDIVQRELRALLDSLLHLQQTLLSRHRETQSGASGGTCTTGNGEREEELDEEIPTDLGSDEEESEEGEGGREGDNEEEGRQQKRRRRKRKCPWRSTGYEEHISSVHSSLRSHQEDTIAKWDTKLRLASGKLTNKAFVQVDRSTVAQIKHVLEDKERLVKRSQLKRSVYRVLGKREEPEEEEGESHDSHLRSHDQEIYDEDDFYHQLLKDLIERKMNYAESADPVAMGRQWLALQKLRSKVKKKVDTKASKGRKVRYDVHPKLVGFMAPVDRGDMFHSARNDLFVSLFGAHSQQTVER